MKVSTVTCLFVSKGGALSVRLMDAPVPAHVYDTPLPGMVHACMMLGITPRTFKRTAEGNIPVFEEE